MIIDNMKEKALGAIQYCANHKKDIAIGGAIATGLYVGGKFLLKRCPLSTLIPLAAKAVTMLPKLNFSNEEYARCDNTTSKELVSYF